MRLRHEGITWQEIDGELVILDVERSVYLTTNAAGALLAKLLVEERSMDDLTNALISEYGIEECTAQADATEFVAQLRAKQLLQ